VTAMKFAIDDSVWNRGSELVYRAQEYSFDSDPRPEGCISSVVVNDLELEVDDEGVVICVTGLCPHLAWQRTERAPPPARRHVLRVIDQEWVPGISKRLTSPGEWPMFVNRSVGYVCVGSPEGRGVGIEFAPGCVAVLQDGQLLALWLRPKGIPPENS